MAGVQDEEQNTWWHNVEGSALNQGDWLERCYIPVLLSETNPLEGSIVDLNLEVRNVIVLTQSCDLENGKAPLVAVVPFIGYQNGKRHTRSSRLKVAGRASGRAGLKVCTCWLA